MAVFPLKREKKKKHVINTEYQKFEIQKFVNTEGPIEMFSACVKIRVVQRGTMCEAVKE